MGFTFRGTLPKGFVLSKPGKQDSYEESEICDLERQGRLIITRKRDGWKLFLAVDAKDRIRFFTDGPREVADGRLATLAAAAAKLGLSPRSLYVGEGHFDKDGTDELGLVQSFFAQRDPVKSVEISNGNGGVRFAPFGAIYMNGRLATAPFAGTLAALRTLFDRNDASGLIRTPEVLDVSFDEAKKLVVAKGWEGLVLYDAEFRYEFRLDGKDPKRPWGCWKWKPVNEDDFIVRDRVFNPDGSLKELVLSQIGPDGREFYCGKLGAFTRLKRAELASHPLPFAVQAEFDARYPKTGKIRTPRFVRVRDDKRVEECTVATTYPERAPV